MKNGSSRRELLAAFLGAPLALSGCGRPASALDLPAGELVGASADVGHRLRNSPPLQIAEDRWENHRVAIVGGGIAGLTAARHLRRAGIEDFILLELELEPGGTSRFGRSEVVSYPWGAHYVPAPTRDNPELIELLGELGVFEGRDEAGDPLVAEQFCCRYPQERVFFRGRWYEGLYLQAGASEEDARQFAAFRQEIDRWVDWRDAQGRRAFTLPMSRGSMDGQVAALDKICMADWMDQRGLNSSRLRWYVDYACRDDYGMRLEHASAWAGIFYFASRRRCAGDDSRPFITWPEGNGRIVSHLYRQAKSQCRLGWAVADIHCVEAGDGQPILELTAIDHAGRQTLGVRAERVIFAAPHFLAQHIIRPYRQSPPSHVAEFQYGAWAVANLTLDACPRETESAMAWDNVIYESPSLGYVSATHQRGMDHGPCLLTYYYPLCDQQPGAARRRLLSAGRDEWAEIALSDLERAHPQIRQSCRRLDVMRWGHAMILPRPGFITGAARREAAQPFQGIHFANTDLSGVALFEEAFYRGLEAAKQVVQGLLNPAEQVRYG